MNINENLVKNLLPLRPMDANKGTFGKALIVAGSKNFPGAAILSCLSAARVGAGLVTLATDEDTYKVAVPKIPFVTFLDFSEVEKNIEKYDVVLIGPGLGMNHETGILNHGFLEILNKSGSTLVIDADGLNALTKINKWFEVLKKDAILTPHPGEMARLTNLSVDEIQKNREGFAKKYAKEWNKTVVLKGAKTVIASPDGKVYKAEFKNPLLATAGTGDVLAGIIAGLLAQDLDLNDAAIAGVYIHGMAGERLKEKFEDSGATSLDLVVAIPETIKNLKRA